MIVIIIDDWNLFIELCKGSEFGHQLGFQNLFEVVDNQILISYITQFPHVNWISNALITHLTNSIIMC